MSIQNCLKKGRTYEEARRIYRAYQDKYYNPSTIYPPSSYSNEEIRMIMEKRFSDKELSDMIGHSVRAIQIKRCNINKMLKGNIGLDKLTDNI